MKVAPVYPLFKLARNAFKPLTKTTKVQYKKSVVVDIYNSICLKYIKVFRYFSVTSYIRIIYGVKFPEKFTNKTVLFFIGFAENYNLDFLKKCFSCLQDRLNS